MNSRKPEQGFTLIEVLTVITIIGILIAIGFVSYNSIIWRANMDVCLANQKTIEAVRMYNLMNEKPLGSSLEELEDVFKKIGFIGKVTLDQLRCPSGGTYTFDEESANITCSIERHNP